MKLKIKTSTQYTLDISAAKKWINKTFAKGQICEDEPDNPYLNTSDGSERDARDKLLKVVECVENQDWLGFADAYFNLGYHKEQDYPLSESVPEDIKDMGFMMLGLLKGPIKQSGQFWENLDFKVTKFEKAELIKN